MSLSIPIMTPGPGEKFVRFVGDRLEFSLRVQSTDRNLKAFLRTNIGNGATLRKEIIDSYSGRRPLSVEFWRNIPFRKKDETEWVLELACVEVGFFHAKAYVEDEDGNQAWPHGADVGISVHPDSYRTNNTIYCAFVRMFGPNKTKTISINPKLESSLKALDKLHYSVIPPSGTFRDLIKELPHITETLHCRIVHLLPVSPTPTTFARMGRFGSPYACMDLTAIDPSLVEFDQIKTGIEQFCELTDAVHLRGAKVFLDIVINHTGWGSTLYENHPEWFLREANGMFKSPGAWGVVWGDLVELEPHHIELWQYLADAFLTWCRRGVDGFRCDAGYKVPLFVWQYIIARVRQEFPDTIFLLEGLGGAWELTESLLCEGGMQWAYSELFQNFSPQAVSGYLDHSVIQSNRTGLLVHYSETHDNERLAQKGKKWSLLRNRLSALASHNGAFGFTCGVEWLAEEKIDVHESRGLAWGAETNIVNELESLNRLLGDHPCFFDGATIKRHSHAESPVLLLERISHDQKEQVLIVINIQVNEVASIKIPVLLEHYFAGGKIADLLVQLGMKLDFDGKTSILKMKAGSVFCLGSTEIVPGAGKQYRKTKAQAAWATRALAVLLKPEQISGFEAIDLARRVERCPYDFLSVISALTPKQVEHFSLLNMPETATGYSRVMRWKLGDETRLFCVPHGHWLLVEHTSPFKATFFSANKLALPVHEIAVEAGGRFVCAFAPRLLKEIGEANLELEIYCEAVKKIRGKLLILGAIPKLDLQDSKPNTEGIVLLTNGIGGMARIPVNLGSITSKYDCVLGASLHATVPVDRHIFVKRIRLWMRSDGFVIPLSAHNLVQFEAGPPARWTFRSQCGDGRQLGIVVCMDMIEGKNATVLSVDRETFKGEENGKCDLRLTLRVDIEDRNFHSETKRNPGAEQHFGNSIGSLKGVEGFEFNPAQDRHLVVFASAGTRYHDAPEWCENIAHPIEQTRGQTGSGDAYSPGWFDLQLSGEESVRIVMEAGFAAAFEKYEDYPDFLNQRLQRNKELTAETGDGWEKQLKLASAAFIVRRDLGKTVIAGYPWFLDWGRDSLICARGMLAGGFLKEVRGLLEVFGKFVENGTMPNTIHGEFAGNRDTSDAPLLYAVVCADLVKRNEKVLGWSVDAKGRTIAMVLEDIAEGYIAGTTNGIKMDGQSGLVWSPSHFTWMDTNYPAGTPREGYPIEIQVMWIELLKLLSWVPGKKQARWTELAQLASHSLENFFWLEEEGWVADLLIARNREPAIQAQTDKALRSNYLWALCFGHFRGVKAQRALAACASYLVIPGALRSLAPLKVSPPLPIYNGSGQLINDPEYPFWGAYEGDEDSRRKPAYHNGTGWVWTFPMFCEALSVVYGDDMFAKQAALSFLSSAEGLFLNGCMGQLPEIVDGNYPHRQRGCDAQAWSITETYRVWKFLQN
ncbi:MAG: glgE2 [Verrucomicrobiales bacterium]|nr:glgE2 [Verrucomicrobiales bacterium]